MRVAIRTLGCKVNQYETQAMEELLREHGHTLVPFEGEADAYIVNSCTVTAVSDKKSRQAVRNARRRSPDAVIALCGCYPQVSPEEAAALDADLIGGSRDRRGFLEQLERMAGRPSEKSVCVPPQKTRYFEPLPAGGLESRTRAMLKVEDGCANFCSYCIIPYARGPVRSLPMEEAAAEAARLSAQGYRELVLTGIELSSYGRDLPGRPSPADLIETVCRAAPEMRVRLGSLEPRTVTEEFCLRLKALPNLCPHFHLSLQSGCDATLKRMNRRYDTARYLESVRLLREHFGRIGLTTDLITGFPGETEEEFAQTLEFIRECGFTQMHIFPYSRRRGTPAAEMPGQVLNDTKAERAARAAHAADAMRRSHFTSRIGEEAVVLFEEEKDGLWRGYTPQYEEVRMPGKDLHNQCRTVRITAAAEEWLLAQEEEAR